MSTFQTVYLYSPNPRFQSNVCVSTDKEELTCSANTSSVFCGWKINEVMRSFTYRVFSILNYDWHDLVLYSFTPRYFIAWQADVCRCSENSIIFSLLIWLRVRYARTYSATEGTRPWQKRKRWRCSQFAATIILLATMRFLSLITICLVYALWQQFLGQIDLMGTSLHELSSGSQNTDS